MITSGLCSGFYILISLKFDKIRERTLNGIYVGSEVLVFSYAGSFPGQCFLFPVHI